jgi:hypothetical protein
MMVPESRKEMKFVIMKESRVPAPATPASVGVVSGMTVQLKAMIAVLYRVVAIVSRGTKKESLLARSDSFMSARNVVIEMSVV